MKQRKKSFGMRISAFVLSFAMVCTLLAGVNVVAFAADDELLESVHTYYNDALLGGDGEHLFTKDLDEMDYLDSLPTWIDQGEEWLAPAISELAIYRCYNPNSGEHHYAASDEAAWLESQGWNKEKVAFYSADEDDVDAIPVYRLWNGLAGVGSHYYTTDEGEAEYLATTGWTMEDISFYGYPTDEPVVKEMTAVQTGANEITVTTTTPFTGGEEFTVAHGLTEDDVLATNFDEDMCTVIITLADEIVESQYVVACSDIEYDPAGFVGAEATLANVLITDTLIPTGVGNTYAVAVLTLDQFGDSFVVDAWDGKVISNGEYADWDGENGILVITAPDGVKVGDTTSINLISGTLVATGVATYSNPSVPAFVSVSPIMMTEAEAEANQTGRIDVDDLAVEDGYYFEVTALDQYGLPVDADTLNMAAAADYLIVSDGNKIITTSGTKAGVDIFEDDGEGNVIMFVKAGDAAAAGTGSIQIIPVANTAGAATATLTVSENEKIDSITVAKALDDLQIGTPVPVFVSAVNNYGEPVDFTTEVVPDPADLGEEIVHLAYTAGSDNSLPTPATMTVSGGLWAFDNAEYPGVYSIVASGAPIVMVFTNAIKSQQFSFVPVPAAVPAGIYGLSEEVKTTVAYSAATGAAIVLGDDCVYLVDQYGKQMVDPLGGAPITALFNGNDKTVAAQDYEAGDVFYVITDSGKQHVALTASETGIDYLAGNTGDKAVTEKFTLQAFVCTDDITEGDAISAANATALNKTYTLSATVASKNYVDFVALFVDDDESPKSVLYTGGDFDNATLVVYGVDAEGNSILLNGSGTLEFDSYDESEATITVVDDLGRVTVADGQVADLENGTLSVDIWYADNYIDTVELEYSNAPSEPVAFIALKDGELYDLSKGITVGADDGSNIVLNKPVVWAGEDAILINDNVNDVTYTIITVDQYGYSCLNKVIYAGDELNNAAPVVLNVPGTTSLSIKAGTLSQVVKINTVPAI